MSKRIDIGKGVYITDSEDMGMFIHFESLAGHQSGVFLGNDESNPGFQWAKELFEESEE